MTESSLPGQDQQPGEGDGSISITFTNPDVLFDIHPVLLQTWGGDPFLAIKDVGFFLRVVMPVALNDGSKVLFGTWLELHAEDFRTAWQTWNSPEYAQLEVEGYVANAILPWGEFPHVLVKATVRDVDEVPVLTYSADMMVMRIFDAIWDRQQVLEPYADVLSDPAPAAPGRRTAGRRRKREPNVGPAPEGI